MSVFTDKELMPDDENLKTISLHHLSRQGQNIFLPALRP